MLASQLYSIDEQLVTPNNPPRTDLDGMDFERCAALHNYLVDYCLATEGRLGLDTEGSRATYWSEYGTAAEALRPRLHHSMAAFLERAYMFDKTNPVDSLVVLYMASQESFDDDAGDGGLLYHQGRHRATFAVYPEDNYFVFPMDQRQQSWHFLETILSHWIDLIHIGKVVASPIAKEDRCDGFKVGNWEWRPYGDGQVTSCIAAWDRLCHAIEVRRQQSEGANVDNEDFNEPLLPTTALDAANIPDPSFVRDFLSLARRPRHIQQVAPGLSLPPPNATAFAAAQRFTNLPRRVRQWDDSWVGGIVPPVYILFSENGAQQVNTSNWKSSFQYYWNNGQRKIPDAIPFPSSIPPGVYSECIVRFRAQATEEGFRLPLPFALPGARYSDGDDIQSRDGKVDNLFQHGFKPLGGETHRTQRLERLFDHFTSLIERGVWSVGPHGVEGSIEVFKDAMVHWEVYKIPSSW